MVSENNVGIPGIIELQKGVYAPKGTTITEGPVTILVHPYHNSRRKPVKNLDGFLGSYQGNLITFEGPGIFFEETVSRVAQSSNGVGSRFYVKTVTPYGTNPLEMTWDEMAEFIRSFGDDNIDAAGGRLGKGDSGCLGVIARQLRTRGLQVQYLDGLVVPFN
ncbi:hypothetical protein HOC01_03795 [archaeon]|jgi:hypothetical protein|nr:hypothetical protein [archaeon]MBT6698465.1 hypothetical protein [archaeon]